MSKTTNKFRLRFAAALLEHEHEHRSCWATTRVDCPQDRLQGQTLNNWENITEVDAGGAARRPVKDMIAFIDDYRAVHEVELISAPTEGIHRRGLWRASRPSSSRH
jgi:hypothetical protein